MSHIATSWAFQQTGLRPTAKLLLLALADCHNPVHGCFPAQAFLARVCEVNRDTINEHLNTLEERGLIRRERRFDPKTHRRLPTRYKLAFEEDFGAPTKPSGPANEPEKPMSEMPTRTRKAMSEKPAEPCRNLAESHVGNSDNNLVIEQVNKPARVTPVREEPPPAQRQEDQPGHQVLLLIAEKLKLGRYVAPSSVRPDQARTMLRQEMIDPGRLRAAGIAF